MRIQHNIAALNSYRQLGNNNNAVAKNLEKLSSGYRINRAGDDAAGLAISEKMRAQIKGLETAQKNANDGISLVQTAEGALTEVHSMLNRMVELATQSANGTYDNDVDRANLQKEVKSLISEIDRISESTNYNGIKLLDGSLGSKTASTIDPGLVDPTVPKSMVATGDMTVTKNQAESSKFTINGAAAGTGTVEVTIKYTEGGSAKEKKITTGAIGTAAAGSSAQAIVDAINSDDDLKGLFKASISGTEVVIESKEKGESAAKITAMAGGVTGAGTAAAGKDRSVTLEINGVGAAGSAPKDGTTVTIGGKTYQFLNDVTKVKDGMVAVRIGSGASAAEDSAQNLIDALKDNGVEATKNSASAWKIDIKDLDQISVAQKGVGISSDAAGIFVDDTVDVAGQYKSSMSGATTGSHKLTIEYLDEAGKKQTATVDYNIAAGATSSADVAKALESAIKDDSTLSALFDVKRDGGDISLTAKTAGTGGARVIGMKNDEANQAANGVAGGVVVAQEAKDAGKDISLTKDLKDGDTITIDGKTYQFTTDPSKVKDGNVAVSFKMAGTEPTAAELLDMSKNLANALKSNNADMSYDAAKGTITFKNDAKSATADDGKGLVLQVGDTNESFQKVTVKVDSMSTKSLDISDINIGTQDGAAAAIDKIKAAINTVSSTRGDLGAIQNRLDHTINNLGVTTENMTAAESRIRDVDMAKEMMDFTKNNILVQASQAMLAQANQIPQGVLQLLQ